MRSRSFHGSVLLVCLDSLLDVAQKYKSFAALKSYYSYTLCSIALIIELCRPDSGISAERARKRFTPIPYKMWYPIFKPADIEFPREKPEGITVDRTAGGSETIKMVRKALIFRPVAARTFISILLPAILVVKIASAVVLVLDN